MNFIRDNADKLAQLYILGLVAIVCIYGLLNKK